MIGTLYSIITRFKADTSQAEAGVDRLGNRTDRLADRARDADRAFEGMGAKIRNAAAAAGGFAILGKLIGHVGNLNKELADAEISIATVFSLNKVTTFEGGLVRAKKLIGDFRKAAITSPGESRDLLNIFKRTAPSLAKLSLTDEQITSFSSRGLASAFTLMGGDVDLTGDQLSQILMGQMGADNRLFQSIRTPLSDNLGLGKLAPEKQVEAMNKLTAKDPRKFFDALMKTLEQTDKANAAFSKSFTGMIGSLSENINMFLTDASAPLFGKLSGLLSDALGWLDKNDKRVKELTQSVGLGLSNAWNSTGSALRFVNDNLKLFIALGSGAAMRKAHMMITASALGGVGVTPLAAMRGYAGRSAAYGARAAGLAGGAAVGVGRGARAAYRAPGAALGFAGDFLFGNMFGGANTTTRGARAAAAVGRGRAGAGAALAALPGLKTRAGAAVVSAGGIMPALAQGLVAGGGALKPAAGAALKSGAGLAAGAVKGLAVGMFKLAAIAGPAIVVIGMIAGAIRVLKDDTNDATIFLKTSFKELRIALDSLAAQFGFGGANGGFGSMVKKFADWLGTGVVGLLGAGVKGVELFVSAFGRMIQFIRGTAYGLGNIMSLYQSKGLSALTPGTIKAGFNMGFDEAALEAKKAEREAYMLELARERRDKKKASDESYSKLADERLKAIEEKKIAEKQKEIDKATAPNINVQINNVFETENDPDKIALRIEQITGASIMSALRGVEGLPGLD